MARVAVRAKAPDATRCRVPLLVANRIPFSRQLRRWRLKTRQSVTRLSNVSTNFGYLRRLDHGAAVLVVVMRLGL